MNAMATSVQGMQNNLRRFESHAGNISRFGTDAGEEVSAVSLPEEMVGMQLSRRGFEANAAVFRAQDEMLGSLLDTFA